VILYHFTNLSSLESILLGGLHAADPNGGFPMFGGSLRPCVWLTSLPEPENLVNLKPQEVRITVELRSKHKRLISFPELLRTYPGFIEVFERFEREKSIGVQLGREPTDVELTAWRHWWLYFGNIPPRAIRSAEKLL
jgi:hypothetical protein